LKLLIDIGNTLQKIAVVQNDDYLFCESYSCITIEVLLSIFSNYSIKYTIVSSVAAFDKQLLDFLTMNTKLIHYSHQTKLPISIKYKDAETLGLDRIANAVGAATIFPHTNVLSIQAGTCLVLDFVNDNNEYLGGSISPGIKMRFEALHEKTKKLPLITIPDIFPNFIEITTTGSLCSGIINGMCHEIDGFIEDYKSNFENLKILLTGGDASSLQKLIKNTIFAAPNLVLKGLNEIIKYNV
jgi:type III pantothenate kinase